MITLQGALIPKLENNLTLYPGYQFPNPITEAIHQLYNMVESD